jgi:hypothetical protein
MHTRWLRVCYVFIANSALFERSMYGVNKYVTTWDMALGVNSINACI